MTTADILDRAAQLELFGRPQDTYVKRLEKLQALTLAEVHGAIKRHLKSSELRVFALADPKAAQLDQLGPVTLVK